MKRLSYFFIFFLLVACSGEAVEDKGKIDPEDTDSSKLVVIGKDTVKVISDYDMSTVNAKERKEFKENLVKIEKEHGVQWDFCTCVVKNDSINKAFSKPLADPEFDRLSDRLDVIEKHCQAFIAQSPNMTPDERTQHEKKVKKCLKEAGVK